MRRRAVVTGAAGGVGAAVCRRLLKAGFEVVATDLRPPEEIHERLAFQEMDVADPARVLQVAAALDRLHVLVNAAGVFERNSALKIDEEAALRMVQVNLLGALRCTAAFGARMKKRGSIVNVASVAGLAGAAMASVYAATKGGLLAATRSAARELASRGIAVNAVAPGYLDTPMADGERVLLQRFTVPRIPVQRLGRPEEVAEVVLFLARCRTDYLTGAVLTLDGGLLSG